MYQIAILAISEQNVQSCVANIVLEQTILATMWMELAIWVVTRDIRAHYVDKVRLGVFSSVRSV